MRQGCGCSSQPRGEIDSTEVRERVQQMGLVNGSSGVHAVPLP